MSTVIPESIVQSLMMIELIIRSNGEDHWIWKPSSKGLYTATEGYSWLCVNSASVSSSDVWTSIWKLKAHMRRLECLFGYLCMMLFR